MGKPGNKIRIPLPEKEALSLKLGNGYNVGILLEKIKGINKDIG